MTRRQFKTGALATLLLLHLVFAGSGFAECWNEVRVGGGAGSPLAQVSGKFGVSQVEFTDEIIRVETDTWMKRHRADSSWKFGDITARENCAGYVFRKRFKLGGPYLANVEPLYEIAKRYGHKLTGPERLAPKIGDIVFYGPLKHVAVVVEDGIVVQNPDSGRPMVARHALIEGKDNEGPYLRYRDGEENYWELNDRWGAKEIWHIDAPVPVGKAYGTDQCRTPPITCPAQQLGFACEIQVPNPKSVIESLQNQAVPKLDRTKHRWLSAGPVAEITSRDVADAGKGTRGNPKIITRTFSGRLYYDYPTGLAPFSCTQSIRVEADPPLITTSLGKEAIAECESEVQNPKNEIYYHITAGDSCGQNLQVTCNKEDRKGKGCVRDPLVITRIYTATDESGVSSTFSRKITVIDKTAPTIGLHGASLDPYPYGTAVKLKAPEEARTIGPPLIPMNDNCGEDTLRAKYEEDKIVRRGSGVPGDPHIVDRKYRAEDKCGNLSAQTVLHRLVVELDTIPVRVLCDAPATPETSSTRCTAKVEDGNGVAALSRLRASGGKWGYYWYVDGSRLPWASAARGGETIRVALRSAPATVTATLMVMEAAGAPREVPRGSKDIEDEFSMGATLQSTGAKALEDHDLREKSSEPHPVVLAQREVGRGSAVIPALKAPPPQRKKPEPPKTEPTRKKYGPFAVPWGSWFSTGVVIKKGEGFSVKATGAYRSVNQNTDVKTCGPDGCGPWRWFVLKAKIGSQMMDVGSDGGGTAASDGTIEFGSPRGSEFRADDAGNCTGSLSVELWVDAKSRR
jgi:hypothetical protein